MTTNIQLLALIETETAINVLIFDANKMLILITSQYFYRACENNIKKNVANKIVGFCKIDCIKKNMLLFWLYYALRCIDISI